MRHHSRWTHHLPSLLVAGLLVVCAPRALHAQHPPAREGFYVGTGLGYGTLGITGGGNRHRGTTGYVKLGGAVRPNLLLGVEANGWDATDDRVSIESGILVASLTYYPVPNSGFFLNGGPGMAGVEADQAGFSGETDMGFGVLAGGGYDFRVGDMVSITPSLSYVWATFDEGEINDLQFAIGVTLH
jgi:hypothetical protein